MGKRKTICKFLIMNNNSERIKRWMSGRVPTHYCLRVQDGIPSVVLLSIDQILCSSCSKNFMNSFSMTREDYAKARKIFTIQEFFQNFPYGENIELRTHILQKYNIDIWDLK